MFKYYITIKYLYLKLIKNIENIDDAITNKIEVKGFNDSWGDVYHVYDDYDWEQENFNALTDGQYGDYDDFNGDWDRLDDERGA